MERFVFVYFKVNNEQEKPMLAENEIEGTAEFCSSERKYFLSQMSHCLSRDIIKDFHNWEGCMT